MWVWVWVCPPVPGASPRKELESGWRPETLLYLCGEADALVCYSFVCGKIGRHFSAQLPHYSVLLAVLTAAAFWHA